MAYRDLVDRVEAWLVGQEWQLNDGVTVEERGQFLLSPSDGDAPWPLLAVVDDDEQRVLFYSVRPEDVPEAQREKIATLLTRINYGLLVGAVETDLDDGEVRVRTGVELGTFGLDDEDALGSQLARALGSNLALAEAVWDAVDDVLDHGTDPHTAAQALEG